MAESPEERAGQVDKLETVEEEVVRLPRKSPLRASGGRSPRGSKSAAVGGGNLTEKFAAAAARSKSKGKGKEEPERDREQEEKDKEDGRDLDIILAPPKPAAGPSKLPTAKTTRPTAKPSRVPVVAKRGLTPRKATVGGVRAKRAWKG